MTSTEDFHSSAPTTSYNCSSAHRATYVAALVAMMLGMLELGSAAAQTTDPEAIKRRVVGDDVYLAGGRIDLKSNIDGDAIVAGGHLKVEEEIRGDATLAGGIVALSGNVSDDARVAGGDVDIDATIQDDLVVVGGNIVIQKEARVGGEAWLAGGDVYVFGTIDDDLEIFGGTVTLGGTVAGDVDIAAGRLEILPTARISGDLNYASGKEAVISDQAVIQGSITRNLSESEFHGYWHHEEAGFGATLVWIIGLTLTGMLFLLAAPHLINDVTARLQKWPWKSLGLGLITLVATPVLAVISMALIVGIPLGLLLIATYLIALLIGYLTSAVWLGDFGLNLIGRQTPDNWPWRTGALFAALLMLSLLGLIPFVGGLVLFVAVIGGLGAWTLIVSERLRTA